MKENSFIERNGKYNLEVTGEQLAWIFATAANVASGYKVSGSLFEYINNLSPEQFKMGDFTNNIGIPYMSLHGKEKYKEYLNTVFTKPLSEEEKQLKELQDTINKAQAEIEKAQDELKKAQEQIKGLKKV